MTLIKTGRSSLSSGGSSKTNTFTPSAFVDASIIARLQEAGYVLTLLTGDSNSTEAILNQVTQYIWPSSVGNIPAFRDSNNNIYLISDRQMVYTVITNVKTDTTSPNTSIPTRGDVETFTPIPTNPTKPDVPVTTTPLGGGTVVITPIPEITKPPEVSQPIPPGGLVGSGNVYTKFNIDDIVPNQQETVTRAMWTNNVGNLLQFHLNPNQTDSQKKYYLEVYNTGSTEDCLAEPQFSVSFGNRYGSGSEDLGVQVDDTPTRAIYGQYRLLCLGGEKDAFVIGSKTVDNIYAININRARFREWVDEGNIQINLQALTGYNFDKSADNGFTGSAWLYTGSNIAVAGSKQVISLIDDSRINDPVLTSAGEVYQIVSGSLENSTVNGGVYLSASNPVVYGLLYKRLGVVILDAEMLDDNLFFGTVIENSTGGGEINGDNPIRLFKSLSGSAAYTDGSGDYLGFQARSAERVKSTHYFCRLKNAEYNFSNNPSFVTGSDGDLRHPSMINDPKTYVTTVGLYNDKKDLVAVAKLSKPFQKHFSRESVVRVKLEY